jgi:PAS domain S-box-containing protein
LALSAQSELSVVSGIGENKVVNRFKDNANRYAIAVLAALAALYLRHLLTPLFGERNPYHTVWLAIVFCSWYCGLGPSIVSTLVCVLGINYFFLSPGHSIIVHGRSELYGMLGFVVFSSVIIAFGESNRRGASSRFLLAAIVDSSDDAIISKNLNGVITSWNEGAKRIFGWTSEEAVGQSITILIPPELRHEETEILKRLANGERIDHFETIRRTKSGERVDVALTISPVKDQLGRIVGASKIARDITERKRAEERLQAALDQLEQRVGERTAELLEKNEELVKQTEVVRDLSGRLLRLQDEERRRIARELHDSVGQSLAAVNLNTSTVAREKGKLSPEAGKCVEENVLLIEQSLSEIRTISYLLHPPLLDEMGLQSAIRWFIEGYAQRTKIKVNLDMASDFVRLATDLELAIFRIVQECLTNIHRHSESATARVHFGVQNGCVHLEVSDEGKGIPPEKQLALHTSGSVGVGFRGMRERIRQLGGALQVRSNANGTTVSATLPVRPKAAEEANVGVRTIRQDSNP